MRLLPHSFLLRKSRSREREAGRQTERVTGRGRRECIGQVTERESETASTSCLIVWRALGLFVWGVWSDRSSLILAPRCRVVRMSRWSVSTVFTALLALEHARTHFLARPRACTWIRVCTGTYASMPVHSEDIFARSLFLIRRQWTVVVMKILGRIYAYVYIHMQMCMCLSVYGCMRVLGCSVQLETSHAWAEEEAEGGEAWEEKEEEEALVAQDRAPPQGEEEEEEASEEAEVRKKRNKKKRSLVLLLLGFSFVSCSLSLYSLVSTVAGWREAKGKLFEVDMSSLQMW